MVRLINVTNWISLFACTTLAILSQEVKTGIALQNSLLTWLIVVRILRQNVGIWKVCRSFGYRIHWDNPWKTYTCPLLFVQSFTNEFLILQKHPNMKP
ncbi:hypothetical protein J3F84DRAFT_61100 [Trichoderma pleuroticola]